MNSKQPPVNNDYPYIRMWERYLKSNRSYTQRQLKKARELKAPETTIFFREGNEPALAENLVTEHARNYFAANGLPVPKKKKA